MEEIKPTTKIIDMTGKTQREIKDMRQIPSQLKKQKSDDSDSDSDSRKIGFVAFYRFCRKQIL